MFCLNDDCREIKELLRLVEAGMKATSSWKPSSHDHNLKSMKVPPSTSTLFLALIAFEGYWRSYLSYLASIAYFDLCTSLTVPNPPEIR